MYRRKLGALHCQGKGRVCSPILYRPFWAACGSWLSVDLSQTQRTVKRLNQDTRNYACDLRVSVGKYFASLDADCQLHCLKLTLSGCMCRQFSGVTPLRRQMTSTRSWTQVITRRTMLPASLDNLKKASAISKPTVGAVGHRGA